MTHTPSSTELPIRRNVLIELNHAAKKELVFDPEVLEEQIGGHTSQQRRYDQMRGYALTTFLKSHDIQAGRARNGAGNGFRVVTELLSIASHAFLQYCEEQGIDPSLIVLNRALHASRETPLRLMNLPDSTNIETEAGLGLRGWFGKEPEDVESGFFGFRPGEDELVFHIDDERFDELAGDPDYDDNPNLPERWQHCPARRLITERIWPAMVDLATDTPAIFAQDLGIRDTI